MKTWVLCVVAVLVGVATADELKCLDEWKTQVRIKQCMEMGITHEEGTRLQEAHDLAEYHAWAGRYCTHAPQNTACLAGMRHDLESCSNKKVQLDTTITSHLLEHMMPGLCEEGGERLAYLLHQVRSQLQGPGHTTPFKRCFDKVDTIIRAASGQEIDPVSQAYLKYKAAHKYKACLDHVEGEGHKQALEWLLKEALDSIQCVHPESDTLVLCKDMDVTKLKVTSICQVNPLNTTNLYDHLEDEAVACYIRHINHHEDSDNNNHTDLDWLKEEYKKLCNYHRHDPTCLLIGSAYAEACLSSQQYRQFQLFVQWMEDFTERSCVEDGARFAVLMHEVYRRTPEHGHALRDCHETVVSRNSTSHGDISKNMRFYHDMIAFKECVLDKLHTNSDVAKGMDDMINDVLRKMKCVNPDDDTVVLCETIHQH